MPHNNPYLYFKYRPGGKSMGQWINSLGFRDIEFNFEKTQDIFRVTCIGDSVVAGERGPVHLTFPRKIAQYLKYCRNKKIEIINCGLSGTNSKQQEILFKDLILPLKPDMLLWMFTGNDLILSPYESIEKKTSDITQVQREAFLKRQKNREKKEMGHFDFPLKDYLRNHSKVYGHFSLLYHRILVKLKLRPTHAREADIALYQHKIATLNDVNSKSYQYLYDIFSSVLSICKKNKIKFLIVLLPEKAHFTDKNFPQTYQSFAKLIAKRLNISVLNLKPVVENIYRQLKQQSGEKQRKQAIEKIYLDVVHFTPWMKDQLSPFIADFIKDNCQ
jgi:RNase H-fold protein (predicted Holliday junction resolvase)